MKITLPRKVLMIINNLQLHGYEAFAVGGCVRDSILARRPEDWDITTSAKPEEIKRLFREAPQIAEQVDRTAYDRARFFGNSSKGSSPTPGESSS